MAGVTRGYPKTHYWGTRMGSGHGYTLPSNGSLAAAGLDSNCNLQGGTIGGDAAAVQGALAHLFAVQVRLGLFDTAAAAAADPWAKLDERAVGSAAHQRLALEAAQQAHVLLKNTGGTLPLSAAKTAAVVLVGPCLEVSKGGYSAGGSGGPLTTTTQAAIEAYLGGGNVTVVAGCGVPDPEHSSMGKRKASVIDCPADPAALALAVAAAGAAGAAVVVAVGIDGSFEGENGDYRAIVGEIGRSQVGACDCLRT